MRITASKSSITALNLPWKLSVFRAGISCSWPNAVEHHEEEEGHDHEIPALQTDSFHGKFKAVMEDFEAWCSTPFSMLPCAAGEGFCAALSE